MIPPEIVTEDGRKRLTVEFLRVRLAENRFPDAATPSSTEMLSVLGITGDSWNELLRAGFSWPCTVGEAKAWFAARGWV